MKFWMVAAFIIGALGIGIGVAQSSPEQEDEAYSENFESLVDDSIKESTHEVFIGTGNTASAHCADGTSASITCKKPRPNPMCGCGFQHRGPANCGCF